MSEAPERGALAEPAEAPEATLDIVELVDEYLEARKTAALAEESAAKDKALARAAEERLAAAMEARDVPSVRHAGSTLYLFSQPHASISAANVQAIREALTADNGTDEEFVEVGLNRQRVVAFYRGRWEKGLVPPEALKWYVETRVGVRAVGSGGGK